MLNETENSSVEKTVARRTGADRKPESLDGARTRFARLLRARIAEKERELAGLRAELTALGGEKPATATRRRICAICSQEGHTRRTCPQAVGAKIAQDKPVRA